MIIIQNSNIQSFIRKWLLDLLNSNKGVKYMRVIPWYWHYFYLIIFQFYNLDYSAINIV